MKKEKLPDALKLENGQKKQLLSLGLKAAQAPNDSDPENITANLLFDMLASKLPADPKIEGSLPDFLWTLRPKLRSVTGETIGKLLQNKNTNISYVEKIKDQAKQRGTAAKSKPEHDASLAIYYAAIAYALVHYHKKISDFTSNELIQAFRYLCKQRWITMDLSDLLTLAVDQCKNEDQLD